MSFTLTPSKNIILYIDADACPVKQEVYRVAERHALKNVALKVVVVVTNTAIAVPRRSRCAQNVMAGLVPAIHVFLAGMTRA